MDEVLGKHFTLEELVHSQIAVRLGLDNTPDAAAILSLKALVTAVLDPLRELLGVPILVDSGYRSIAVNVHVGGSPRSQHCSGEAADLVPKGVSIQAAFDKLRRSTLPVDQVIEEGTWLHVSHTRTVNRREFLRVVFVAGKPVYSVA